MFILSMSLISKAFAPDSIFGRECVQERQTCPGTRRWHFSTINLSSSQRRSARISLRYERDICRAGSGRCTTSAVRTNTGHFPSPGEVHNFRGAVAFLSAFREGQHRRQSLGGFPCSSQKLGGRRRIQSRTDQNVHSVGSVRGVHIPTAASPLDGPSWIPTVRLPVLRQN
jgi:hypothetical protein